MEKTQRLLRPKLPSKTLIHVREGPSMNILQAGGAPGRMKILSDKHVDPTASKRTMPVQTRIGEPSNDNHAADQE
jgi:hypothetical protein